MIKNLKGYLSALGCESIPERWAEILPEVIADYNKNGCEYARPEFYNRLSESYGMLDGLLDTYISAAEEVGKNELLSITLMLIARASEDRPSFRKEQKAFKFPIAKEGEPTLAYDMLPALALAAMADGCYERLASHNIPKEHIDRLMKAPEGPVRSRISKGLSPRHDMFDWQQHAIDGKLYTLGRLQIHLFETFGGYVSVFKNAKGETVPLADGIKLHRSGMALGALYFEDEEGSFDGKITETDDCYEGYPYLPNGIVSTTPVKLKKDEWEKVLCYTDYVIKLHIPSGGGLTPEAVDDSLARAREFVATYYPEFEYKGFCCYSWLCDHTVADLVGEDSNIGRFAKRFQPLTVPSNGRSVFRFVYQNANIPFDEIPETTSLGRALKKHYSEGKAVYDFRGYFFPDGTK